ncbi:MAG: hypothetical protein V7K48_15305 [Nostoc sp.]|uniref:hypothetical protein n=1 Tax=Nostoc sp. TaxID=1180 RepID=UPI002FF53D60
MTDLKLDIAFWDYDRTQALADGTVKIDGVDAGFHSARIVTEIFERMIRQGDFDVSELGMTYFLRTMDFDAPPFIAIPVFLNRCFRHSAIYVHTAAGIKRPQDLAGKTVGELAVYGHDAGVMPKGILSDDYGVTPDQCRWIVGGLDWPLKPIDFVPHPHPANVEVTSAPQGSDLGEMLEAGEIDALISADVPKCVLEKSPMVSRLFNDYEATERAYFQRTGIFPIMHTVVVSRELASEHPEIVKAVYKGFCDAKDVVTEQYKKGMIFNNMATMVPWFSKLIDADRSLLGEDWWPYGVNANRKAVDTYLRYHFEQGLSKRRLTCEDIFVPELLGT